jgi:ornithine lipid hydroxylase
VLWKVFGWDPSTALLVVYWLYLPVIYLLERLMPFEPAWIPNDGQLKNDLALTVMGLLVNSAATVLCLWILTGLIRVIESLASLQIWPTHWPMWLQVPMGIVVWDLGQHLAHRLAHKLPVLWRFHAVHHAAPRLSVINTGRLHPLDVAKSVAIGAPIPVLLGIPPEIAMWYATFNVFVGFITHSNINVNCGIFNQFLSTPNLHRWHHSPHREETDTNFGEATMVWDRLFGTYFNPARPPPRNVGLNGSVRVSTRLWEVILHPLTPAGHRASDERLLKELPPGDAGVV